MPIRFIFINFIVCNAHRVLLGLPWCLKESCFCAEISQRYQLLLSFYQTEKDSCSFLSFDIFEWDNQHVVFRFQPLDHLHPRTSFFFSLWAQFLTSLVEYFLKSPKKNLTRLTLYCAVSKQSKTTTNFSRQMNKSLAFCVWHKVNLLLISKTVKKSPFLLNIRDGMKQVCLLPSRRAVERNLLHKHRDAWSSSSANSR